MLKYLGFIERRICKLRNMKMGMTSIISGVCSQRESISSDPIYFVAYRVLLNTPTQARLEFEKKSHGRFVLSIGQRTQCPNLHLLESIHLQTKVYVPTDQ